jgi:nickel-type superoxide dismutase maturation protease
MFPPFVRLFTQAYPGTRARNRAGLIVLSAGLLTWVIVRTRPFRVAVEGPSMAPTLQPGDFLVATIRGLRRRGSLVVVDHPGRSGYEMVKRIAAVPGGDASKRTFDQTGYWLLGDNPWASTDSRTLGPVPEEAIRGVIRLRYWPPSRFTLFG